MRENLWLPSHFPEHTGEPWRADYTRLEIIGGADFYLLECSQPRFRKVADVMRIVACVNACAGVSNDELEKLSQNGGLRALLKASAQSGACCADPRR
jgi:hypothetical protein